MIKGINFVGVAVVFFCHDGKGNFLMQKRSKNTRDEHDKWDIGAGGVEVKDSVENTLKKEIKEEYCCNVLSYEFLGFRDVLRKHKEKITHWVTLDFKVLVNSKLVKNGEPHKFSEIGWFRKNTMPKSNTCHSQIPKFMKKYKNFLWK